MDCCENTKQKKKENMKENQRYLKANQRFSIIRSGKQMKGGKSMVEINKKTMLWIVIGILVIATIFLTFKASSIGTGAAQATASAARTAASTASSGMVGGC